MSIVNLSQLIGRKNFTVLCTLSKNRSRVKTAALANTRANAFALLDTKCAQEMSKFLNTPLELLEKPILVKGYNRQTRKPINSILQVHLLWRDRMVCRLSARLSQQRREIGQDQDYKPNTNPQDTFHAVAIAVARVNLVFLVRPVYSSVGTIEKYN